MLYSVITALCIGIGFYFGFVLGKTGELPKFKRKSKDQKKQEKKESKEIKQLQDDLDELNRYDGTRRDK